jgi:2-polyprenyl-3-methyl-5-hydroxy-6-metoxy-1,4-benzoquinol methylase
MALNVNTRIRWNTIKDLDCLNSLRNRKVLEIGCGLGFFSVQFKEKGGNVLGVDVDEKSLVYLTREHGIQTTQVDVDSQPLPGGGFDLIFIGEVLEHINDPAGLVRKVADALDPDGTAILTTPALEGWLTKTPGKQLAHDHGAQKHERIGFSREELEALAADAGLDFVDHRYCVFTLAELFMQFTKLAYLASKKTYEGQSDVLAVTNKTSLKILKAIYPLLWAVFRLEDAVCRRINISGHCHVLVVRKRANG